MRSSATIPDPMAERDHTDAILWGAMVLLVVIVLVVPAWAGVDHGCKVSPPPLDGPPDPGTPRGDYCDTFGGAFRWIGLVVLPAAVVAGLTLAVRKRHPIVPKAAAVLVCGAALANWIFFDSLDWALTV